MKENSTYLFLEADHIRRPEISKVYKYYNQVKKEIHLIKIEDNTYAIEKINFKYYVFYDLYFNINKVFISLENYRTHYSFVKDFFTLFILSGLTNEDTFIVSNSINPTNYSKSDMENKKIILPPFDINNLNFHQYAKLARKNFNFTILKYLLFTRTSI